MPFIVPNEADATYPPQAQLDSVDLQVLAAGSSRTGVLTGSGVTAQGSPNMTLAVAAGTAEVAGAAVTVTSGNVTIGANSSGNPRIDLVSVSNAGTKTVTAGTAAAAPESPDIPADHVVLAVVYVPDGVSAITNVMVNDRRVLLSVLTDANIPSTIARDTEVASEIEKVSWKPPAILATTANITRSGEQTIDGISAVADYRVLVKNQSAGAENGLYVVSAGAWTRAADADESEDFGTGIAVYVKNGTTNGGTLWTWGGVPPTVGSSTLIFAQYKPSFGAAGYPVDVTASESDGTADLAARSDHGHKYGATSITDAHVAAANKDGAIDVPSFRTVGSDPLQAAPGDRQFTALDRFVINQAIGVTGVSGAAATAQGSPDMTVAVASGTAYLAGTPVAITSGNVTIGAADGTFPRIDLVTAHAVNGTKTVTAGTAAFAPVAPGVPAFHAVIAVVRLPAAATAVTTAMITDKRLAVPAFGSVTSEHLYIPVGDETTTITTGTAKVTFRMPFAMTVNAGHNGVKASLATASSSGIPTIDINDGGTTILSTKLTIDASEKTSATAAAAPVVSDTALAADAEITIDIDVAGTGAKGLKVWILGVRA